MHVYPCGYATAADSITHLMQTQPNLLMIDTRYTPWSSRPAWRGTTLRATYGERYRWAGRYLGNVNYKNGGPICLANPEAGLRGLRHLLQRGNDLLLLCGCAVYERCHLRTIVEALKDELPEIQVMLSAPAAPANTHTCLSIRQPWTWLLTHPEVLETCGVPPKRLENRDWYTRYRGPLLLHAGASFESGFFERRSGLLLRDYWTWRFGPAGERLASAMPQHRGDYATRSLVGSARLVDVVDASDSPWFVGTYGFVLAEARALTPAVPYPGSLMLFKVPMLPALHLPEEARP